MEPVNACIAPENYRILDMNTLLFIDDVYHFRIGWDDGYHLIMDETGKTEPIPDTVVRDITARCQTEPGRSPYLINEALRPLKQKLIDSYLDPVRYMRIDAVLNRAAGYAEQDGKILFFFDAGSVQTFSSRIGKETAFCLKERVTASGPDLSGTLTFTLYDAAEGVILKLRAICEKSYFIISSLYSGDTMQYLSHYQKGEPAVKILRHHKHKTDAGLKGLFSRKT